MRVFEIGNPVGFRDLIKVLSEVNTEVNFDFSYEGVKVLSMDPSHVSMIDFFLPREAFDVYDVEQGFTACFNLENVNKALKKTNKYDEVLRLDYDFDMVQNHEDQTERKENERITLTLISDLKRKKTLELMEALEEEVPQPKIFFKSATRLLISTFKRILDDFKGSSEHLTVKSDSEGITFSVKSNIMNEETPVNKNSDTVLDHQVEDDVKSTYALDYLHRFVRAISKVSEVTTIRLSEDMPLKLDVELPQGHLYYFVAPCLGV